MQTLLRVIRCLACLALLASATTWAQQLRTEPIDGMGKAWTRAWVDADGDGRDDFCFLWGDWDKDLRCYLNKSTGMVTQNYMNLWQGQGANENGTVRWADVNGDGFVDVCRAVALPSQRLVCRFGPTFTAGVEVPWTIASSTQNCTGSGIDQYCDPPIFNPGIASVDFYPGSFPSGGELVDFHLADVDGDGIPDLCYPYRPTETVVDMRCRIAVVGAGRMTVTYQPESAAWTRANVAMGADQWPEGFYDFDGDGRADFCRVLPGGVLRCTLASATGFVQTEVSTAAAVSVPYREGAAFVDINGDGKVDFCRLNGTAGAYYIRCTLSNGVSWEYSIGVSGNSRELVSPTFADPGNQYSRWWVDINGDGFPDFCRLAVSPDPIGNWTSDVTGNLLCRLSRGDGDAATSKVAFGYSDVSVNGINLGRADGGRAFCDATGTGIQTLCRATFRQQASGQACYTNWDTGEQTCYPTYADMHGYWTGYNDTLVQARQPLLNSYSDNVGAETRITYMPLASPEVYSRSNTTSNTDARILLMQPRSPVVYETRAWTTDATPVTLTGNARYLYKDLRTDVLTGSRGFRERWIYNEGANMVDHVVYYQALGPGVDANSTLNDLREVGMAKCQEKYAVVGGLIPVPANQPNGPVLSERMRALSALRVRLPAISAGAPCSLPDQNPTTDYPFVLLQATNNTPGLTTPNNPRFKFVASSSVKSWDWNGSTRLALPISSTTSTMDDVGNVLTLVQSTRDSANREWRKTTTNVYGQDNRTNWLLGRLTRSQVDAVTPTAAVQIAANGSSVGPPGAERMSPATPVPQPLSPAALAAILQLLLDD